MPDMCKPHSSLALCLALFHAISVCQVRAVAPETAYEAAELYNEYTLSRSMDEIKGIEMKGLRQVGSDIRDQLMRNWASYQLMPFLPRSIYVDALIDSLDASRIIASNLKVTEE
jgi:hypothetical protein